MMCIQVLNDQRGHITTLRKALKLLDILEMSEQERAEVGMVQQGDNIQWADQERRFPLEIADRELAAFLKRAVAQYQGWPVAQGRLVLDLFEQLGIENEGESE